MKSRLQTLGWRVMIMLGVCFTELVIAAFLLKVDKVLALVTAFGALATACGTITSIVIARYGARETAVSLKGNWPQKENET